MRNKTEGWRLFDPQRRSNGRPFCDWESVKCHNRPVFGEDKKAQVAKDSFIQEVVENGSSPAEAIRKLGITSYRMEKKEDLHWVVVRLSKDVRMAVLWDGSSREFIYVKGFVSNHRPGKNNRNPEYKPQWEAWRNKVIVAV